MLIARRAVDGSSLVDLCRLPGLPSLKAVVREALAARLDVGEGPDAFEHDEVLAQQDPHPTLVATWLLAFIVAVAFPYSAAGVLKHWFFGLYGPI
ncbi:MAG TPA: hypothetical protein VMD98_08435 [Bryocella sp.]|nr:hypothetical protein [Bryocella sp.]